MLIGKVPVEDVLDNLDTYYQKEFWFTKNGGRSFFQFVKRYDEISDSQDKTEKKPITQAESEASFNEFFERGYK